MVTHMHDPLILKLCLESKKPVTICHVTAWAWTHVFHQNNHEGIFREIQLVYDEGSRKWDDDGVTCYEFHNVIYPTHNEEFRLTFNVKFHDYMLWVDKFQNDHVVTVDSPRLDSTLVNVLHQRQVTKKIYMGNYLSVLLADEMNYEAVLNLDQLTEEQMLRLSKTCLIKVIRLCNELNAGGGNEIPGEKVVEIVNWLRENNAEKDKILVGDRIGLGRVGSALTAYIYANNPNLTYDEAYHYVRQRRPMAYCHKGLRDAVTRLYPRD